MRRAFQGSATVVVALGLAACGDAEPGTEARTSDAGTLDAGTPDARPPAFIEADRFASGQWQAALDRCAPRLEGDADDCDARWCAFLARTMLWIDDLNDYLLPTFRSADLVNLDPTGLDIERLLGVRETLDGLSTTAGDTAASECRAAVPHLPLRLGDEADPIVLTDVRGEWTPRNALLLGAIFDSVAYVFDATARLVPPPPASTDGTPPPLPELLESIRVRLLEADELLWAEPADPLVPRGGQWDRDDDGALSVGDELLVDFFEPGGDARTYDFSGAELVDREALPLESLVTSADLPQARCGYEQFHIDTLFDEGVGTTDGMAFSPDGTRILFPKRGGDAGLYQVHSSALDGSSLECITCNHPPSWNDGVRWQPHGNALVFVTNRDHPYAIGGAGGGFGQELYAMRPDGSEATRLTTSHAWATNYHANFSEDGRKLVWGTTEHRSWDVMVADFVDDAVGMRLENVRRLTHDTSWWETHGFSQDGRFVLTTNTRAGWQASDLYALAVDGSERRRLTDHVSWDEHVHLSPDGRKLVWISARWSPSSMYRMTDGSLSAAYDFFWIAPAIFFAFMNPPSGFTTELTMMDADGEDLVRLTDDAEVVADSAWSPDATRILFRQTPTATAEPAKIRLLTFDDCAR